jgi:hypothetical protein
MSKENKLDRSLGGLGPVLVKVEEKNTCPNQEANPNCSVYKPLY